MLRTYGAAMVINPYIYDIPPRQGGYRVWRWHGRAILEGDEEWTIVAQASPDSTSS